MLEQKLKNKISKLFKNLNIQKNNNIIIHSNSAGLLQFNNKKKVFDIFGRFKKKRIGKNGTVVFPTYNYNILNNKKNYLVSQVGLLSNIMLKKKNL